jgi:micrococcal nuclease
MFKKIWEYLRDTWIYIKTGHPPIKGNKQPDGDKIYHLPGSTHYDKVKVDFFKGEQYFWTERDAIKAGYRKSKT